MWSNVGSVWDLDLGWFFFSKSLILKSYLDCITTICTEQELAEAEADEETAKKKRKEETLNKFRAIGKMARYYKTLNEDKVAVMKLKGDFWRFSRIDFPIAKCEAILEYILSKQVINARKFLFFKCFVYFEEFCFWPIRT